MFTNFTVIDKYTNIISGSSSFFNLVGAQCHSPLISLMPGEDSAKFASILNDLKPGEKRSMVAHIKNTADEYPAFYASISISDTKKDSQSLTYHVEITELDTLPREAAEANIANRAYLKLLGIYKNPIIEYNPQTGMMQIYTIRHENKYEMYSGGIDEIREKFISDDMIAADYISTFDDLISDIKNCVSNFRYELVSSISTEGQSRLLDIVTGGAIMVNNKPEFVVATFSNDSNPINSRSNTAYETDPMTGLLNKTSILQYAKNKVNFRKDEHVVIAILDMDNFKNVNDNLGHAYGDKVIIHLSKILSSAIGSKGAVGRFGGDEFMIVLKNVPTIEEFRSYFRAIRSNVEQQFKNIGDNISVTCSIGIARCPEDGDDFNNLFALADKCLYLAKDFGRNRYVYNAERSSKYINANNTVGNERKQRVSENNDFMLEMNKTLYSEGEKSIPYVLDKIATHFSLTRIKIYFGENFERKYYAGSVISDTDSADYLNDKTYVSTFDGNNMNIIDNINEIQLSSPLTYDYFVGHNVYSVIQYLIKDENKVKGLISYELIPPGRCWHNDDIDYLSLFSQLIGQIILNSGSIC